SWTAQGPRRFPRLPRLGKGPSSGRINAVPRPGNTPHKATRSLALADDTPPTPPPPTPPVPPDADGTLNGDGHPGLNIADELRDSHLPHAMSAIVSRALPDVRDGLKPSQRRILVSMNDLNLGPTAATSKCAAIVGDTMGRYHPHGDQSIYATLVRMAQNWNMRHRLVHPQGNFGSIAGLPPPAQRYTQAPLPAVRAELLADLERET